MSVAIQKGSITLPTTLACQEVELPNGEPARVTHKRFSNFATVDDDGARENLRT